MTPVVTDLDDVPAGFLNDELEDWRAYRAYRAARIDGFDCRCLKVTHDRGTLTVPYFTMDFNLNTMLPDGKLKALLGWARLKVACVGNPLGEHCQFEGDPTPEALEAINSFLETKAGVIAYKGFGGDLRLSGFTRTKGLPLAVLDITPSYWDEMSYAKRRNLRRKLKGASKLKVVEIDSPSSHSLATDLFRLYEQTYARATTKFEKLTEGYFVETAKMSKFLLFYEESNLIGFVQIFTKGQKMGLYYGGLDYARAENYGLYFVLFLRAIEIALRDGYREISCGLTTYEFKKFLGCRLQPTYIYYRHRNRLINFLLSKLAFLLEPTGRDLA